MLFFDIETVYSEDDLQNQNSAALHEKYAEKLNFMAETNKIITICVGFIDNGENKVKALQGTEQEQLIAFSELCNKEGMLCGFNIKGFDIPFVIKRMLKFGIVIPNSIKTAGKKPWEISHIDLFEEWRCGVFGASGNLDMVCRFLGITSPKEEGLDGSKVKDYYDQGKLFDIEEYCKRDVVATMELYKYLKRLNFL